MSDPVFFAPSRRFTAAEIAVLTGAELRTPERAGNEVGALASAGEGGPGTLVFVDGRRNAALLDGVDVSVLICSDDVAEAARGGMAVLVSRRPQQDFAAVGRLMFPAAARPGAVTDETGVSPAAHVHAEAEIEPGAVVEAGAVVGARAAIGSGAVIAPNAVIGPSCRIGRDSYIGPGATVLCALIGDRVIVHPGARIGQDGFGFVGGAAGPEKVPQLGRVVIQDDVEIGANTTIDRGALSDTVIGQGTKIDNLVQIAHNVRIGRACILAGHCGISGSVTIGDGAMLGGRVGIADHVTIGERAQIGASSGLMNDVAAGERVWGTPAQPAKEAMRELVILRGLVRKELEKRGKRDD